MLAALVDKYLYAPNRHVDPEHTTYVIDGKVPCNLYTTPVPVRSIVYVHGNATSLATLHDSGLPQQLSRACNAFVLAIELPGYGADASKVTVGKTRDSQCCDHLYAALRYLRRKGGSNIAVVGRSLGVAVVLKTFARFPGLANNSNVLVLVSGFASVRDMCQSEWLKPFVEDRFCNKHNITAVNPKTKVVIIHGTADPLIPFEHAKVLHAARPDAVFVPVIGMQHGISDTEMQQVSNVIRSQLKSTRATIADFHADVLKHAESEGGARTGSHVWDVFCPLS